MGCALLTATLLLLMQHGREGAAQTIDSKSTGNVLTGNNISLDISLNPTPTIVVWLINSLVVSTWTKESIFISPNYTDRLSIIGNRSLLITNATKNDAGNYTVTVVAHTIVSRDFQVKIYDPVENVTVTQSPLHVNEKTLVVNLSCSASGDAELITWKRNEQVFSSNDSYSLQDGNKTLQIKYPNRTFSGNYTCNVSNPVSWNDKLWELNVSYTDNPTLSGGAIAGIVIGSVAGALLLIALIVLLVFCIPKRQNGKEKKIAEPQHKDVLRTVSGNTLSPDDPAYFTMNNIMYRNSSISMGSYIMNSYDNTSENKTPLPNSPLSRGNVKRATQV